MTYELTWTSRDRKPQDKINTIPPEVFRLATYGAGYSERPDSLQIFRFLFFGFREESFFWSNSIK